LKRKLEDKKPIYPSFLYFKMFNKQLKQRSQYQSSHSRNEALDKSLFCLNNNLPESVFPELLERPQVTAIIDVDVDPYDEEYIDINELIDLDEAREWRYEMEDFIFSDFEFKHKDKLIKIKSRKLSDKQFMLTYKKYRSEVKREVEIKEKEEELIRKEKQRLEELEYRRLFYETNKHFMKIEITKCTYSLSLWVNSSFNLLDIDIYNSIQINNKIKFRLEILLRNRYYYLQSVNNFYMQNKNIKEIKLEKLDIEKNFIKQINILKKKKIKKKKKN